MISDLAVGDEVSGFVYRGVPAPPPKARAHQVRRPGGVHACQRAARGVFSQSVSQCNPGHTATTRTRVCTLASVTRTIGPSRGVFKAASPDGCAEASTIEFERSACGVPVRGACAD